MHEVATKIDYTTLDGVKDKCSIPDTASGYIKNLLRKDLESDYRAADIMNVVGQSPVPARKSHPDIELSRSLE